MATSLTITGVTFPDSTTQTTAYVSGGGVTSITAGNGISVNASTGAVTVTNSLYAPSYNAVGSYIVGMSQRNNSSLTAGASLSVGTGYNQFETLSNPFLLSVGCSNVALEADSLGRGGTAGISGTWRSLNYNGNSVGQQLAVWLLAVRIA